ncbi:MAG: tRNA (N(6)-L-threonylcarbamoyladenosine(37)-C(2))-methylthiotransferase MtaB [Pseudomonadota bacterium]
MRTFFITTLGCKVNQYESDGIASELIQGGWLRRHQPQGADIIIVNTCAVTSRAGMQSRQSIRSLIRSNPEATVIVTGCHAQTAPETIGKIPGVHHILGHKNKLDIAKALSTGFSAWEKGKSTLEFPIAQSLESRNFQSFKPAVTGEMTRTYLKIQDGCDAFCSYCIVPYSRGRSSSMPVSQVLEHLDYLGRAGYPEVILSGIHVGAYGHDLTPRTNLAELLKIIIKMRQVGRFRLSSIEPVELTDEILELAAQSPMFCDHFHIPLQNGDDTVLERMKRPYTTGFFRNLVNRIRTRLPGAGIGIDIMMGFPGETDQAFQRSYALIQELPVSYLHVFPFSARPGTQAWDFSDKIPPDVIKQRCSRIRALGEEKKLAFARFNLGKTLDAVVQNNRDNTTGLLTAVTSNYLTLLAKGSDSALGCAVQVRLDEIGKKDKLYGTVL